VTEARTDSPAALVTADALSLDSVVRAVAHAGAGAVVTFLGTVRDTNDGRPVTELEYEAYASMASTEISRIIAEIERELEGVRVAVHHRTGALGVGDTAVVCAASAPHRGEAFTACRRAIDRVKERVPIWKREHGPDGPYWVGWVDARCSGEGEPSAHAHEHTHASSERHKS
jgi:molybdopterin synthase catalytic subunit